MKFIINKPDNYSDIVYTPEDVCIKLIQHFKPTGLILEPAAGDGAFYKNLPEPKDWCEIEQGRDFFDYTQKVDWVMTNPPWSLMRKFLNHSYKIADNVCFLIPVYHLWTKARLRDMKSAGFGIKEICVFETPKNFPQLGFAIAMCHLQRGWEGDIKLSNLENASK